MLAWRTCVLVGLCIGLVGCAPEKRPEVTIAEDDDNTRSADPTPSQKRSAPRGLYGAPTVDFDGSHRQNQFGLTVVTGDDGPRDDHSNEQGFATSVRLSGDSARSGSLGSTIANILSQLTGGAVHSISGGNIPSSNNAKVGHVNFFTATDPASNQQAAAQPSPQVKKQPVIITPQTQRHSFIAISPLDAPQGASQFAFSAAGSQRPSSSFGTSSRGVSAIQATHGGRGGGSVIQGIHGGQGGISVIQGTHGDLGGGGGGDDNGNGDDNGDDDNGDDNGNGDDSSESERITGFDSNGNGDSDESRESSSFSSGGSGFSGGVSGISTVGSRVFTQGSAGGRVVTQGSVGSRVATQGSAGGRVVTQGSVGSRVATQGSAGGRVVTPGSVGSRVATQGSTGGRVVTQGPIGSRGFGGSFTSIPFKQGRARVSFNPVVSAPRPSAVSIGTVNVPTSQGFTSFSGGRTTGQSQQTVFTSNQLQPQQQISRAQVLQRPQITFVTEPQRPTIVPQGPTLSTATFPQTPGPSLTFRGEVGLGNAIIQQTPTPTPAPAVTPASAPLSVTQFSIPGGVPSFSDSVSTTGVGVGSSGGISLPQPQPLEGLSGVDFIDASNSLRSDGGITFTDQQSSIQPLTFDTFGNTGIDNVILQQPSLPGFDSSADSLVSTSLGSVGFDGAVDPITFTGGFDGAAVPTTFTGDFLNTATGGIDGTAVPTTFTGDFQNTATGGLAGRADPAAFTGAFLDTATGGFTGTADPTTFTGGFLDTATGGFTGTADPTTFTGGFLDTANVNQHGTGAVLDPANIQLTSTDFAVGGFGNSGTGGIQAVGVPLSATHSGTIDANSQVGFTAQQPQLGGSLDLAGLSADFANSGLGDAAIPFAPADFANTGFGGGADIPFTPDSFTNSGLGSVTSSGGTQSFGVPLSATFNGNINANSQGGFNELHQDSSIGQIHSNSNLVDSTPFTSNQFLNFGTSGFDNTLNTGLNTGSSAELPLLFGGQGFGNTNNQVKKRETLGKKAKET